MRYRYRIRLNVSGGTMEYAVKAETHEGKVMILQRGFASEEEAEDHPIQMSLWKRVWVEPVDDKSEQTQ